MARYYLIPRRFQSSLAALQPVIWRLEAAILMVAIGILRALPLRMATAVTGRMFAALGVHPRRAAKVRGNLAVACAGISSRELQAIVRANFYYLGVALVELVQLGRIWRKARERIEFVLAPGAQAPSSGRPSVFVTAHVGAWQFTPLIGPRYGVTLPIIYSAENNPYVDRQLARLRGAFGCPLVSSAGGVRVLMQALERKQCIGLTLDTRLNEGEPIPFFGEPANTNTVAARLALRYQCDLVPVLAERLPRARYRVNILPPIRPRDPQADTAAQARDMTAQVNQLFEQWIRQRPAEWFCLKRRWPRDIEQRYLERLSSEG